MKKNLTKGVLISAAALVAAVLFYLMTDINGSAESLYLLNANNQYSTYGTKTAFKSEWYYVDSDMRVRKQDEYAEDSEQLTPPDYSIGTDTGNVSVTVIEGTNEEFVYNVLADAGFSDEMICGIMGNLLVECGGGGKIIFDSSQGGKHNGRTNAECLNTDCMNPNVGGDAHGVAQWDSGRRINLIQGAINKGVEWFDPPYQMSFLMDEINSSYYSKWVSPSKILSDMPIGCDPIEWSCFKWCKYFEVCQGANSATWETRAQMAGWNSRLNYAMQFSGR